MAATIMTNKKAMDNSQPQGKTAVAAEFVLELDFVKCECCGFAEECTPGYIKRVRDRYGGQWICGLCSEAVKDEMFRSEVDIDTHEALNRHMKFCKKFQSSLSPPADPTHDLISAVKYILKRSLDSPRKDGSSSPN